MNSGPDVSSNPYQAPAEAIDFVEASQTNKELPTHTIEALQETRPWVKLVAVLGLLAGGVNVMGGGGGLMDGLESHKTRSLLLSFGIQAATGIFYCIGSVLLLRYVSSIGDLLVSRHVDHLDAAIESQKSFWRFVAVAVLLFGGVLLLLIIAGLARLF